MDIPNASGHPGVNKRGFLQKLSSRSFPYIPHPWKRRYCVLVKGRLFYYEREDSKGADKGSGVINLEYYDQVVEAPSKDCKKATNVFVLTSQDRSFFDPGRHLFSADTPHEMSEWMRHLKKAIEQIRNNHRTTSSASAATASAASRAGSSSIRTSSNPSSPRPAAPAKLDGVAPKTEAGGGATGKEGVSAGKDRGKKKDSEEAEKVRKKRGVGEEAAGNQTEDNKENLEDWTGNNERKQAYPDNSLRRRKVNPSSRSMDENSLGLAATKGSLNPTRKKPDASLESGSGHSSLGRKKQDRPDLLTKTGDSSKPGGVRGASQDYMMFGSLGRQASYEKVDAAAGSVLGNAGGHVERKKRKADDDEVEMEAPPQTSSQLESVTKHRVKGPAGRRMPQHRRSQHPVMKHRASSLSALTHSEENTQDQDDPSASFVPWLNRSLDLLGEDDLKAPCRNSQPALGYIYSDEDVEEADDRLYEYNIGFHPQNLSFDENNGLYVQEGPFAQQNSDVFNALNLSSGGIPPPLPPRMESRIEFQAGPQTSITMQNQFQMHHQHQQLQQQLHQMQYQATLQQQNQMCSPFGTAQTEMMSERDQKMHNRKSQPFEEMGDLLMTRSLTNELFISSYSDENSCDASNPHLHQSQEQQCRQQQFKMESASQQQKQIRPKLGSKNNGQKNRRPMSQPDINRFTVAVRNLQKHVVELDQAVNEITKEVEDSKVDLGSISSSLAAIKKDKERLNDAISIVSQEACKVKEQVAASLKEAEKLQKTATAALVVAEKAKLDQQHLKTEYEVMLRELKSTIEGVKREAQKNISAKSSPFICKRMDSEEKGDGGGGGDTESEEDDVIYQEKKDHRKKNKESSRMTSTKSKENKSHGSSSKSSGYQSFFSRPSSIISGLTNRASLVKSTSSIDSPDKESKDKSPKIDSKASGKMLHKDKQISRSFKETTSSELEKPKKILRHLSDDFPMMDETGSPRALSPISSSPDITQSEHDNFDSNYSLLKSTSSPTVPIRPGVLNLTPQSPEASNKAYSASASPDSPTRPSSPFDVPRLHLNGRATSPLNFPLHRPGSTPGPLNRQGSMTTVPEDRAVDLRTFDSRPTDPPPPPPANRIFAISRQSSTPNISLQKTVPAAIQRQHSLGVVHEENKSPISRQSSVMSMPDDRLIVDQTLPMSPTPSMMSFPGSWSTTSLNRPDSTTMVNGAPECSSSVLLASSLPKGRPKGALDQVAGGVLSGSSLQIGVVCSFDENNDEPPLATSSLKKRKKVKKDVVDV